MMETLNAELMKTIKELKALPKRDRKAIERQLSGLDKLAVKKAFKIKPVTSSLTDSEEAIDVENEEGDIVTPNLTMFSPGLKKILSERLELDENNLQSGRITQAVKDTLPECIEYTNSCLGSFIVNSHIDGRATFKSMLLRLRG